MNDYEKLKRAMRLLFNYNGVAPKVSALLMGDAVIVTVGVSYEF